MTRRIAGQRPAPGNRSSGRAGRLIVTMLLVLGLVLPFTSIPALAAPVNRYVSSTGDDGTEQSPNNCTDATARCRTIQHAIDVAADGDTIIVASGTYTENPVVDLDDLTLRGANAGIPAGPELGARGEETILAGGIRISADDVTVDGFRIQGGATFDAQVAGIYVDGNYAGHAFINNRLLGGGTADGNGSGIRMATEMSEVSDVLIQHNEITNWNAGITIFYGTGLSINENNIHGNGIGILTTGIATSTITSNHIVGNSAQGIAAANVGEGVNARFNRIAGNGLGVAQISGEALTARENWWGCSEGPNELGCSNTSGTVQVNPWLVLNFSANPETIVVGAGATLTADLTMNSNGADTSVNGHVPDGTPVEFAIEAGSGSIDPTVAYTTDGVATARYVAAADGVAEVSATVDGETQTAEIEAIAEDLALALTQSSNVNAVGESHTVTATVTYGDDNPLPGVEVIFKVTGAHTVNGTALTNANGQATFSYTGTNAGQDTITATVDIQGSADLSQSLTKVWQDEAAGLTLSQETDTNQVNEEHTVTATVTDEDDNPLQGIDVEFQVTGAHSVTATVATDSDGEATFSYTGTEAGQDTITARVDIDDDGEVDLTASVTKFWTEEPGPGPGVFTPALPTSAKAGCTYFAASGHNLCAGFRAYWEDFGGLLIHGYPLTEEFVDPETGHVTQYFERSRFEWQPGEWPERYDVLLGLLGNELTEGRKAEPAFKPAQPKGTSDCMFFPETDHNLCAGFRAYWESNGGLPVYGYTISEELREVNPDLGVTYTVQYTERQRFEWHPGEWPEYYDVFLGRLGAQILAEKYGVDWYGIEP